MQEIVMDSSNVTLPTLGAAEGGAVARETEVEAQAAAEAAEEARTEVSDRAEQQRARETQVQEEHLGRTIDLFA